MTATHLVTFRIGDRVYAAPLEDVREVVRLTGLADLPGTSAPFAGVLDLRGSALPVLDLRRAAGGTDGDVLVLAAPGVAAVGVAVDGVAGVVRESELPRGDEGSGELPAYVLEVRRGAAGPVFVVDLRRMVDSRR